MAKRRVAAVVKIQIPAGQATPAPPVGTALGPHGVATRRDPQYFFAPTNAPLRDWDFAQVWTSDGATYPTLRPR